MIEVFWSMKPHITPKGVIVGYLRGRDSATGAFCVLMVAMQKLGMEKYGIEHIPPEAQQPVVVRGARHAFVGGAYIARRKV